jgi:hypothetical protein
MHIFIYTYISQLYKRGVIAEGVKAASGIQKVVRSNSRMSAVSMEIFPIFMGKLTWTISGLVEILLSASGKNFMGKIPHSSEWNSVLSMYSW